MLLLLAALPALAYLPDPEGCCSQVEVRNSWASSAEGPYTLATFHGDKKFPTGDEVLMKNDSWGVMIITYLHKPTYQPTQTPHIPEVNKWAVCEVSHGCYFNCYRKCYLSQVTNATCVEESGTLQKSESYSQGSSFGVSWTTVSVLCPLALALHPGRPPGLRRHCPGPGLLRLLQVQPLQEAPPPPPGHSRPQHRAAGGTH